MSSPSEVAASEVATPEAAPSEATAPRAAVSASGLLHALGRLLPYLIVFGTLAAVTWHASRPLTNNDTYFHLRFGHEFLSGNWSLWDPGSPTTFGTNDWVPTQWLPQIVMAQTESWFGLAGVAWLEGLMHLALAVTLWVIARGYAGPLTSAAIVAVAMFASSPGLSMRPQVISYLLVALTTEAWLRSREDGRARWWLIPATWVWAMCHGMWPAGIVIGVVAVVGIALDRAADRRSLLRLAAVPVGAAVAAALTPIGPALYPAVLLVGSRGDYFAEWQPTDFTKPASIALLVLAGACLLRLLRRTTPTTWTDALLVGLACAWALYTTRTVTVGAVMLVPLGAKILGDLRGRPSPAKRKEVVAVVAAAIVCLGALSVMTPRTAADPPADPSWARTIDRLPAGTPVLNDWGKGGWMMWRWPDLDFVMNGYGDLYTSAELDRNYRMNGTYTGWVSDAQSTGTRYALLTPGSSLAYELIQHDWTVLHAGPGLELLIAPPGWPDRSRS